MIVNAALSLLNSQTSALCHNFSSDIMNQTLTPYTYNIPFSCHDVFSIYQQETIMDSVCMCMHVCVCFLFSQDRSPAEFFAIV